MNRRLVAMALVGLVVIAGCGGSSDSTGGTAGTATQSGGRTAVIDAEKVAARIQAEIEGVLGKKIKAVNCPADQEVVPEARFKCTVTFADGDEATAALKILNPKAEVKIVGLKPAN